MSLPAPTHTQRSIDRCHENDEREGDDVDDNNNNRSTGLELFIGSKVPCMSCFSNLLSRGESRSKLRERKFQNKAY